VLNTGTFDPASREVKALICDAVGESTYTVFMAGVPWWDTPGLLESFTSWPNNWQTATPTYLPAQPTAVIAMQPRNNKIILAVLGVGTIAVPSKTYLSLNGGQTFNLLTNGLPSPALTCAAIDWGK
jgi:hypothetical protein